LTAMSPPPVQLTLDLRPARRFELIDVSERVREVHPEFFTAYRKAAFCSFHTTAGYLDQRLCARLDHCDDRLGRFVNLFRRLFPKDAGYYHDRMELRDELTEAEKVREPVNADSHLAFMGAGLRNLATYDVGERTPVYFIDLDGVNGSVQRTRRTAVLGYGREEPVHRGVFDLPTETTHAVDSFDLRKPEFGLFEHVERLVEEHGIERGRIDLRLPPAERDAGLTVNEYETLLMRNDLPTAMRHPLRYLARSGGRLLRDPGSLPGKARDYAIYDLLRLYNEVMDVLGVGRSVADRLLSRLSGPAYRLFRLKRRVSYLVISDEEGGGGRIAEGRYQSPILIQHQPPERGHRQIEVSLWRFT